MASWGARGRRVRSGTLYVRGSFANGADFHSPRDVSPQRGIRLWRSHGLDRVEFRTNLPVFLRLHARKVDTLCWRGTIHDLYPSELLTGARHIIRELRLRNVF